MERTELLLTTRRQTTKRRCKPVSNHLQRETSPYLLQHAENPVDWRLWGRTRPSLPGFV
ncbi:DUF255 domain-containing protein [Pseudoflavonifractor sp. 524-17]|nr:DUF255 domain-containing protein [Pseudoflavonifractor sp. 524-17]